MKIQITLFLLLSLCFNKKISGQIDLDPVVINCELATTTSVAISWDSIKNASNYIVKAKERTNIIKIDTITETQFEVLNLDVNGSRTIEFTVTAVGKPGFNNSSQTKACSRQLCPIVTIYIAPIQDFCFGDSSISALIFYADFSEAPDFQGIGTYTMSGQGVTPLGILDFSGIPVGDYPITVFYEEQNCVYSATDTASVIEVKKIEPQCVANSVSQKVELSWNDVNAFNHNIWVNDIKIGSTDSTVFEFTPNESNEALKIWIEGIGYCQFPTDTLNCVGPVLSSTNEIVTENLLLFPNPASNSIYLDFSTDDLKSYKLHVSDHLGRLVLSERIISDKQKIDISNLQEGLYFFSLKDSLNHDIKTGKITIAR